MPAVALLVFREVLEAALIISIVGAATRGVPRRGRFIAGGVGLGVLGAMLVAAGAGLIAGFARGAGLNLFNAAVLLAAVGMIGWHVLWMSRHGRQMARDMKALGGAVQTGDSSLRVLLVLVALAVLREGSEVVLFLYGMGAGGIGTASLLAGTCLGVAGGAAMGWALYAGLLHIPMRAFFRITNALLMLLAAGLASTAAGLLLQSDLLPAWGTQLWNTSGWISNGSLPGKMLGVLVGYNASPSGIQIAFYLGTLLLLGVGARLLREPPRPAHAG
ncbi:MAG TPA: FTR1 family protein [Frateuria sp.]|uniref:FTR1 family iron permease n=1 Tax=Frateuria sp. TaxID=2211372 RepID=UPI002D8077DD|nr:FTR1 family protein [Frateuria sp.]HET6804049.1 FTR1 family protein [Frateuria sp.]